MAYQPIEPRNGIPYNRPLSPRHSPRPRMFDRISTGVSHSMSIDELPLLNLPYTPEIPVRRMVFEETNSLDTSYEGRSIYGNGDNYVQDGTYNQRSFVNRWRDKLNAVYRYIRSSGPANSPNSSSDIRNVRFSWLPTGWRLGTWFCCSAVALCVILEISMLIYATRTSSNRRGSNILLEGKCEAVRELELWLLLPLNIVGTILIGTSNYVMQVVSTPERKEIDEAHAFAQPIAVAGIRFKDLAFNKSNKLRRGIWWTLGLSSVPIHFLLNAAVFSSVQASNTGVLVVSNEFSSDTGWDYCYPVSPNTTSNRVACSLHQKYKDGLTQRMSISECLRQYSKGFQTNASSVIVFTDQGVSPWYNIPLSAKIPDTVVSDLGVTCRQKFRPCDNSSHSYPCSQATEYADGFEEVSDRNYNFTYNSTYGLMTVDFTFLPLCKYYDVYASDGKTVVGQTLNATSKSFDWAYSSSDDLFLREGDALTNITSVKAVFSAFQYRYWGSAAISGDYLRREYKSLLDNRDPRFWLCPREDLKDNRQCVPSELQHKNQWYITPASMPVQDCHVLPKEELCTLRYSLGILIITIFFDVVKLLAMFSAVTLVSKPLTTLGDIIESFLENPDPYTKNCYVLDDDQANAWTHMVRQETQKQIFDYCKGRFGQDFLCLTDCIFCRLPLHSTRTMQGIDLGLLTEHRLCGIPAGSSGISKFAEQSYEWSYKGGLWWSTFYPDTNKMKPTITEPRRWFGVPSKKRWIWSTLLLLPAVTLATTYFVVNFQSLLLQRLRSPWTVGFEAPDPNSLLMDGLAGTTSIYAAAILINAPQVAFSMLYFVLNATLTIMHTSHEWANFAIRRKALRVSSPKGQQRATYWLQLPWTYSIPLIVCSGSMHWLLSRSLYIVKVDVYGYLGERESNNDYFACGYSPIPSFLLITLLVLLGASVYGLGFRWLPPGMPLVRLNSLAIAAACHPDPSERGLELRPLMWGELEGYTKDGRPHCSFSAKPVTPLQNQTLRDTKKHTSSLNV